MSSRFPYTTLFRSCNPEEAVQIMQKMGIKQALAIHWGTFVLTAEPVDEPPVRLAQACKDARIAEGDFIAPSIGATRIFPRHFDHDRD